MKTLSCAEYFPSNTLALKVVVGFIVRNDPLIVLIWILQLYVFIVPALLDAQQDADFLSRSLSRSLHRISDLRLDAQAAFVSEPLAEPLARHALQAGVIHHRSDSDELQGSNAIPIRKHMLYESQPVCRNTINALRVSP